jgi:hypothetical protein
MAYEKFKDNVMVAEILTERDRATVLTKDCNQRYTGDVKGIGDSVTIKGAGQITTRSGDDGNVPDFPEPEEVEGTNTILTIKNYVTFNFMVKDIDREQGAKGALPVYQKQAGLKIANAQDVLVASMANDKLAIKDVANATQVTKDNILARIDSAIQMLWENDVPQNERLILNVSPRFYMLLKQNYMALDTDNSEMIKRGAVAMYGNVDIKMSNNIYKPTAGTDFIMLRTKEAIAFANPLTKIEPKRANNHMADEIRGESFFGAKPIKPKEMVVLNCKYTA